MNNFHHLTLSDRFTIQNKLNNNCSFKDIARDINKDPSTISKEIRNHFIVKNTGGYGKPFNSCINRRDCPYVRDVCSSCSNPTISKCSFCSKCNFNCSDFVEEKCPELSSPPYVCNGCKKKTKCTLSKKIYDATYSQIEYENFRSESRTGITLCENELARIDSIIIPLIKNGQSLHHIYVNHADELMIDERTLYSYIDSGILKAKSIDLVRKVRYRKRNKKKIFKVDKQCYVNRNYSDFKDYIHLNPDIPIVEFDSVIGKKEDNKVLLTMYFKNSSLFLAFIRDANTSESVSNIVNSIYSVLGDEQFRKLFGIILCDRGSEFSNPSAIENTLDGIPRTKVFYCDPESPGQKGGLEVTHEFVRRILPKGSSFELLTQSDINLMCSHINSYNRKKLNDASAYELFSFLYNKDILDTLDISLIPADDINITPSLLKK